MPIKKVRKQARSAARLAAKSKRVPTQAPGEPRGKHLTGFKGMKVDAACYCGGCHPNALKARGKTVVVNG